MGVIIKYLVDLHEAGFQVSSDPFAAGSGGFILDATITCKMTRGTANSGSTFEIRLVNLPKKKEEVLFKRMTDKSPTNITIKMGYADGGPFDKVMEGLMDKVRAVVEGDNLTTIITGKEYATHALQRAKFQYRVEKDTKLSAAIQQVVDAAMKGAAGERKPTVQVDSSSVTDADTIGSHSVKGANALEELEKLAEAAKAELLVIDGLVIVGNPVKVKYPGKAGAVVLDPDINLGTFEPFAEKLAADTDRNALQPPPADSVQGFTFLSLGDPKMRPGQQVFANVDKDKFGRNAADIFRIHSVVHKFGPTDGYVCQGEVLKVIDNDRNAQRKLRMKQQPTAQSLIDNLSLLTKETAAGQGAAIEIAKVKEYFAPSAGSDKHRATLYYGQPSDPTVTQPSIEAEVETKEDQLAEKRPIISPFAWHKCGLVAPVYKGMKAVLTHNRSLGDDSLVAGFIWSDKPAIEPPASQAGDWWLCLPVDYDGSNPPADSTKAANDLTANNGKRVMEVKGLKITVGADKLGKVGARPTEGDDNVFLIEHKSGTTFQIADDGKLTISASSVSIKGDVTIEGNVEIK
jgi:hypothetical protein